MLIEYMINSNPLLPAIYQKAFDPFRYFSERISSRSFNRMLEEGLLRRTEHSSQRQEVYK